MSCGAETEANALLASLLAGEDTTLPPIDYNDDIFSIPSDILESIKKGVPRVVNSDLTTADVGGSGTFDLLMRAYKSHLQQEFDRNRITGAEYTKAYVALTESAMSQSVSFLLQKDSSYWQAQTAQLQALTARMQFESVKMQLATAKFEALTAKSNYGLTKLRLSTESITYCTAKYNLDEIMPLNKEQLEKQIATIDYQLGNMLPAQKDMILEQMEAQRAQTSDTRSDGTAIVGLLGKQKDLYTQQITSYQRDAEVKAAKLYTDAWITMKTIDEGLEPPANFANLNLNNILATIQTVNNLI